MVSSQITVAGSTPSRQVDGVGGGDRRPGPTVEVAPPGPVRLRPGCFGRRPSWLIVLSLGRLPIDSPHFRRSIESGAQAEGRRGEVKAAAGSVHTPVTRRSARGRYRSPPWPRAASVEPPRRTGRPRRRRAREIVDGDPRIRDPRRRRPLVRRAGRERHDDGRDRRAVRAPPVVALLLLPQQGARPRGDRGRGQPGAAGAREQVRREGGPAAVQLYRIIRADVVALSALPYDLNEIHRLAGRDPDDVPSLLARSARCWSTR